jgi:hypothetical protein
MAVWRVLTHPAGPLMVNETALSERIILTELTVDATQWPATLAGVLVT